VSGWEHYRLNIIPRGELLPRKKTENFNKPALTADEVEPGEFAPKAGRLKEVRGKWPGDEPIDEFIGDV
jgi:hypothetical protein